MSHPAELDTDIDRRVADSVRKFMQSRREEMTDVLAEMVRHESPTLEPATQRPVQQLIASRLGDVGFHVKHISGEQTGGHLYARPQRRTQHRPGQLLLGHCDTVWPVGTLEEMPLEYGDNRMRGPGVYDMKAGLTQMLFAITALYALDLEPPVTPIVFINSDEEIGSPESTPYIELLARHVNRAFVLEPSLGPAGRIKTGRKGVGQFTITVQGKAAHAGLDPEAGSSAILELSHVIQHLFQLNDPERGVSVNVGQIDGGMRPNVVAPQSRAIVDVRVPTQEDAHRIEAAIHALEATTPGTSLSIEGSVGRPPMERTPDNQRLWRLAQEAGDALGIDLDDGFAGGASDGNTTSQYAATLDGLGAVGDGAHAQHEFVYLDKMVERAALLALLMLAPPDDRPFTNIEF